MEKNMSTEAGNLIGAGLIGAFIAGGIILALVKRRKAEDANVTPEDINEAGQSSVLTNLVGLSAKGRDAKVYRVRVLGLARARQVAMWGSKGVNHDEPTNFQRLEDLTDDHLNNILLNSRVVNDDEREIIRDIIEERKALAEADEVLTD